MSHRRCDSCKHFRFDRAEGGHVCGNPRSPCHGGYVWDSGGCKEWETDDRNQGSAENQGKEKASALESG